jgi:glycosyltransferase involved in cell wall biosynthesis
MKIVHLSTFDNGGAGIAAHRIHRALKSIGVDSHHLVRQKTGHYSDSAAYVEPEPEGIQKLIKKGLRITNELKLTPDLNRVDQSFLKNKPAGFELFSTPYSNFKVENHPLILSADIINLHWVTEFVDYEFFFNTIKKPVVWTIHDMNLFTGGCHYSMDCNHFITTCEHCPQIAQPNTAKKFLNIKKKALAAYGKLNVVSPSNWLLQLSKQSSFAKDFSHHHIKYAYDTKTFKPMNKNHCKEILGFPLDKKIITYISPNVDNKRKGFEYLLKLTDAFSKSNEVYFCCVGNLSSAINIHNFGHVKDEILMSIIYNATDLFLMPSLADNLPNVLIESILCGTPALSFNVGGIPEIIHHGKNGIICEVDHDLLYNEINNFINGKYDFNREQIIEAAQNEYNQNKIAQQYKKLYQELLVKA